MFTGIIEEVAVVKNISSNDLSIESGLNDIKLGDSISVNGVCLTVTKIRPAADRALIVFDFSPETARITNIHELKTGGKVNIERALKIGGRLGGHFVSGHVEAVGRISKIKAEDNALIMDISIPDEINRYIVNKGSICVDGVSLTVLNTAKSSFRVAVIPHTRSQTSLSDKKIGDSVNIETDMMAKYAEKVLGAVRKSGLSPAMLKENGFF